ncbi:transcriptional regulator, TetR family [Streptosporangium subroseum]|uniref:Transcriptional regulator, TetR family n=1 Tax=Streptosporangium subroseum TaxID=106412 RepID=A0A239P2L4_9ACTN|nr:TetR/AcrR family transcriptional regulator C-terminal domain-containing protein [Streptosporangium subroseum]SNT61316.1 transcriptional regulator, TetR family [Streptosporangium subroseum]
MSRPVAQPDPPYLRIVTEIRRRIAAGELRAGERVPSTRQVAQEWGVAIATATKALTTLRQQGFVETVPRVGTVVTTPKPSSGSRSETPSEPSESRPESSSESSGSRPESSSGSRPEGAPESSESRPEASSDSSEPRPKPSSGSSGSRPEVRPESRPRSRPAPSRPAVPRRAAHEPDQELTRERIVRTAIAIADTEGLAALSMRGVAAKLGVATMSSYRHVNSKDDLVLLMTDAVVGDVRYPEEPPSGWRARLEVAGRLQWIMYRRHPWLAQVVSVTRPVPLPNLMTYAEWVLSALDGLGLDAETMLNVHVLLYSYVRGIAVNLESEAQAEAETGMTGEEWMDSQDAALTALAASGGAPTFSKVVAGLDEGYDFNLDALFELGLQSMLDGLAILIQRSGT